MWIVEPLMCFHVLTNVSSPLLMKHALTCKQDTWNNHLELQNNTIHMIATLPTFYEINVTRIHVKRTKDKLHSYRKEHLKWLNLGAAYAQYNYSDNNFESKIYFHTKYNLKYQVKKRQANMCMKHMKPSCSECFVFTKTHKWSQKTQQKTLESIMSNSNWHIFMKNKRHSRRRILSWVWCWKPDEMIQYVWLAFVYMLWSAVICNINTDLFWTQNE